MDDSKLFELGEDEEDTDSSSAGSSVEKVRIKNYDRDNQPPRELSALVALSSSTTSSHHPYEHLLTSELTTSLTMTTENQLQVENEVEYEYESQAHPQASRNELLQRLDSHQVHFEPLEMLSKTIISLDESIEQVIHDYSQDVQRLQDVEIRLSLEQEMYASQIIFLEGELQRLQQEYTDRAEAVERETAEAEDFRDIHANLQSELAALEANIKETEQAIAACETQASIAEEQYEQNRLELMRAERNLRDATKEQDKLQQAQLIVNNQLQEEERSLHQTNEAIRSFQGQVDMLQSQMVQENKTADELLQRVEELTKEITQFEAQQVERKTQVEELTNETQQLECHIQQHNAQIAHQKLVDQQINRDILLHQQELNRVESEIQTIQELDRQEQARADQLQRELDQLQTQISTYEQRARQERDRGDLHCAQVYQTWADNHKGKLTSLQHQVQQFRSRYAGQLNSLTAQVSQARSQITGLQSALEQNQQKEKACQEAIQVATQRKNEKRLRQQVVNNEIVTVTATLQIKRTELSSVAWDHQVVRNNIQGLSERVGYMETAKVEQEVKLGQTRSRSEELSLNHVANEQRLKASTANVARLGENTLRLQQAALVLEGKVTTLSQELLHLQQRRTLVQDDLHAQSRNIENNRNCLQMHLERRSVVEASMHTTKSQIADMQVRKDFVISQSHELAAQRVAIERHKDIIRNLAPPDVADQLVSLSGDRIRELSTRLHTNRQNTLTQDIPR